MVINTIAFGPEAPGDLMATIAADTGGIIARWRRTASAPAWRASVDATDATAAIDAIDAIDDVNAVMAAAYLPGQLGLANAHDYFDTDAQGAACIFNGSYTNVPAFDLPNSRKELAVMWTRASTSCAW